jgi:hypothetical protein
MLDECIRAAQEAWKRLSSGHTRRDWMLVGKALQLLRIEAMHTAHCNKPEGRRYNQEYSDLLKANGFDGVDKATRSRLFAILDNSAEIEKWLATVPANKRLQLNHPNSIWRAYQKTIFKKPDDAKPKRSLVTKLNESVVRLEEENTRLKREVELGAPFTPNDKPGDQAAVVWRMIHCSPMAARALCRALNKLARAAEAEADAPRTSEVQP